MRLRPGEGALLAGPKRPDAATSSRQPWPCSLGVLPRYGRSSSFSSTCSRSESSRRFQTSAIVPPGRSTRAISASAGSGSNQWNACPAVTASTLASSSGSASAVPATTSAADATLASTDRISASGSTAITRAPVSSSGRVSLPVPAARSTTVRPGPSASRRRRNAIASGG